MEHNINPNLISYIETKNFPIYQTLDKRHNLNHINAVIKRALALAENFDDINYVIKSLWIYQRI